MSSRLVSDGYRSKRCCLITTRNRKDNPLRFLFFRPCQVGLFRMVTKQQPTPKIRACQGRWPPCGQVAPCQGQQSAQPRPQPRQIQRQYHLRRTFRPRRVEVVFIMAAVRGKDKNRYKPLALCPSERTKTGKPLFCVRREKTKTGINPLRRMQNVSCEPWML